MRLSTILIGLMVLTLVAAAGCTGTTANPELTPDSVATPTPDKITKITAKYTFGDVVQYDRTDTDYQENVALLIVSTSLIFEPAYSLPNPETSTKAKDLYGFQASPHAFHPKEEDNLQ